MATSEEKTMLIKDKVHGDIPIPDYLAPVIRSNYFQRLQNIRQLGLSYLVKEGTGHTRFDHCIGTYYCADRLLKSLEQNTNDLKISEFYWNAVTTAALLHDVGHGPFSHVWERLKRPKGSTYIHEQVSLDCCDRIFDSINPIPGWMIKDKAYAINMIKSFISGDSSLMRSEDKDKYLFLYDIVNNENCSLDVDKWDYLKRDYNSLSPDDLLKLEGINEDVMDFDDVFLKARVSSDKSRIMYRYCDSEKIYNIFKARAELTKSVYKSPHVACLEQILFHIISEMGDKWKICGKNIVEIGANDDITFLELHDKKIWDFLDSIKSPENIVKLVKCLKGANIFGKNIPDYYLCVQTKIDMAGTFMSKKCKEENLFFFGDVKDKPKFNREMGEHQALTMFEIIE